MTIRNLALALCAGSIANGSAAAQAADSLRIFYVGRPVGWESYTTQAHGDTLTLEADYAYTDRGRRIHVAIRLSAKRDYTPREVEVFRVADTARVLETHVLFAPDGRRATVLHRAHVDTVAITQPAFALSQFAPVTQHLALLRYWQEHGRPARIDVVPGSPVNTVAIRMAGRDSVAVGGRAVALTRYTIDGVVWGREYAWLDADGRLAMFASAGGGLSTKAISARLLVAAPALMDVAATAALRDLQLATRTHRLPRPSKTVTAIYGTVVDGTGRAATANAVVVVRDGRIADVGPAATTPVPKGATRIDTHGATIIPGLWDMHAHLHQAEWLPAYLAAGVTTVRDMGNELPFLTRLRTAVSEGSVAGPRILAAGLVDGPGPNAFGEFSATTPDEGRAIVRRYHALGFEQMKLYSLLAPAVVAAICDEAHKLGMTVTGHIPNSLTLLAAVDSGMDQVAHLPLRGDPQSDTLRRTIEHLRVHGTVIDPTISWAEIGGHSTAEPLEHFQPVTRHLPATFLQFRAANWGSSAVDTATAHARLGRSLAIIGALHAAGVPIVAGTDEGVPAFSLYRELELYVQAGMSPMDALRSATAVAAKAMHRDGVVGTLEKGKLADLLVLEKNPLDNISNLRTVRSVMSRGVMYDPAPLWEMAGFTP